MTGRHNRKAVRNCESGSAAVEFALVTPLLLLFLLGIFEFGRVWTTNGALAEAARIGARVLAVSENANSDSVRAAVNRTLKGASLDTTRATITITGLTAPKGAETSVAVNYSHNFMFWRNTRTTGASGSNAAAPGIQLRSSAVMRKE